MRKFALLIAVVGLTFRLLRNLGLLTVVAPEATDEEEPGPTVPPTRPAREEGR